jgi:hypothetical protein
LGLQTHGRVCWSPTCLLGILVYGV